MYQRMFAIIHVLAANVDYLVANFIFESGHFGLDLIWTKTAYSILNADNFLLTKYNLGNVFCSTHY